MAVLHFFPINSTLIYILFSLVIVQLEGEEWKIEQEGEGWKSEGEGREIEGRRKAGGEGEGGKKLEKVRGRKKEERRFRRGVKLRISLRRTEAEGE